MSEGNKKAMMMSDKEMAAMMAKMPMKDKPMKGSMKGKAKGC